MRVNISLPEYLVKEADIRAKSLGISRSAYIAAALQQKAQYDDMVKVMPTLVERLAQIQKANLDDRLAALSELKKDGLLT